jgi:Domain of unknown function (DUF4383)
VRRRAHAETLAALVGAVLLLIGLLGFVPGVITDHGALRFAGDGSHAKLFGLFQVSVLHNLVHLVLGAAGIALASSRAGALRFLVAVGLALLGLWALGVAGGADWLPVNSDDNWLHLALGASALGLGYLADDA